MLLSNYIAIDIGSDHVRVADAESGKVISEPNVLAVSPEDGLISEIGKGAQELMERVPGRYIGIKPVKNGIISDFNMLQALLSHLIKKIKKGFSIIQPKAIVTVPAGITVMQKKEIEDVVKTSGVRDVMLLDAPVAALLGMGRDVSSTEACMVLSIGAGVTEAAVICMDRLVGYKMSVFGGTAFDEAIAQKIRDDLDIWVGGKVTEYLKKKIGLNGGDFETICGKNRSTGLPMMGSVSGKEISKTLRQSAGTIEDMVRELIYTLPEELTKDISRNGILMAGGGAKLPGLAEMLQQDLEIKTFLSAYPENAVINGALQAAADMNGYKRTAESLEQDKTITY